MCVCVCVSVCLLVRNLGEYFVSLLVEPIAGKNVSPSDKQLWRFLKNVLVAEKSQCKALSIGRHLEISSLLLMSAENTETLSRGGSREIVFGGPKDSSPMQSCKSPLYNIKWCFEKKFHNHYDYSYYYLVIGNRLRTG